MSSFAELSELGTQRIWEGVVARAVYGDRMTMAVIELDPGTHLPEHLHDHEQMGFLVRGRLELRVGEETRTLRPGATWRIAGRVPHEAHAGPEGAVVIEAWSPPRSDWQELEAGAARPPAWPVG